MAKTAETAYRDYLALPEAERQEFVRSVRRVIEAIQASPDERSSRQFVIKGKQRRIERTARAWFAREDPLAHMVWCAYAFPGAMKRANHAKQYPTNKKEDRKSLIRELIKNHPEWKANDFLKHFKSDRPDLVPTRRKNSKPKSELKCIQNELSEIKAETTSPN